jgi:hypothetical protein
MNGKAGIAKNRLLAEAQKSIEARVFYWLIRFFTKPTVVPSMEARGCLAGRRNAVPGI